MQVLVFVSIILLVLGVGYLAYKNPSVVMYIISGVGLLVFIYALWLLSGAIIMVF